MHQKVFSSSSASKSSPSRDRVMDFYILNGAHFEKVNDDKNKGRKNAYLNDLRLPVIPASDDHVRIAECKNDTKVYMYIIISNYIYYL